MVFDKGAKTMPQGKDSLFNKQDWENWISHAKNEVGPLPNLYKN